MSDPKKRKEYERLEFLGDRVLNLIVSEYLYRNHPDWSEGELTNNLRFTSNDNLDEIIDHLSSDFKNELITFKYDYIPEKSGLFADDIEAFIGNYYLEKGVNASVEIFTKIFEKEIDVFNPNTDYISILQTHLQQNKKIVPEYKQIKDTVDQNNQHTFEFQVILGKDVYGSGKGRRKSKARKEAAFAALKKLDLK